jgi:chromosome segregation ATPase
MWRCPTHINIHINTYTPTLQLELADTKLKDESTQFARAKDQANFRRASTQLDKLRGELDTANSELESLRQTQVDLEREKMRVGELEPVAARATALMAELREERDAKERVEREVDQKMTELRGRLHSMEAASEVMREKYDRLSAELDKAKEREADLQSQFQVFARVCMHLCVSAENSCMHTKGADK